MFTQQDLKFFIRLLFITFCFPFIFIMFLKSSLKKKTLNLYLPI